jgi:hypothetical protein
MLSLYENPYSYAFTEDKKREFNSESMPYIYIYIYIYFEHRRALLI